MKKSLDEMVAMKTFSLVYGFVASQIAGTTARLGVADLLDGAALNVEELNTSVGADPQFFQRLLAAATSIGMLDRTEGGRYTLTPLGQLYCTGSVWQATAH